MGILKFQLIIFFTIAASAYNLFLFAIVIIGWLSFTIIMVNTSGLMTLQIIMILFSAYVGINVRKESNLKDNNIINNKGNYKKIDYGPKIHQEKTNQYMDIEEKNKKYDDNLFEEIWECSNCKKKNTSNIIYCVVCGKQR